MSDLLDRLRAELMARHDTYAPRMGIGGETAMGIQRGIGIAIERIDIMAATPQVVDDDYLRGELDTLRGDHKRVMDAIFDGHWPDTAMAEDAIRKIEALRKAAVERLQPAQPPDWPFTCTCDSQIEVGRDPACPHHGDAQTPAQLFVERLRVAILAFADGSMDFSHGEVDVFALEMAEHIATSLWQEGKA